MGCNNYLLNAKVPDLFLDTFQSIQAIRSVIINLAKIVIMKTDFS